MGEKQQEGGAKKQNFGSPQKPNTRHSDEMAKIVEASGKIHQLLLNYPGGIDLSRLISIFCRMYPDLSRYKVPAEAFLMATAESMVKFKESDSDGALFAYPIPLEEHSSGRVYARELQVGEDVGTVKNVQVVYVGSPSSFFVYLPGQEKLLPELMFEMSKVYAPGLPKKKAVRIELGRHYAFTEDWVTYKRVRIDYVKNSEQLDAVSGVWQGDMRSRDIHCTLIDFGGEVDLSNEELMQLPAHLNPDNALEGGLPLRVQLKFYPLAIKCVLPLNISRYPLCRKQLYHALTGVVSEDKHVRQPFPVVKVKFMSYNENAYGYIAVPITADGVGLLLTHYEFQEGDWFEFRR